MPLKELSVEQEEMITHNWMSQMKNSGVRVDLVNSIVGVDDKDPYQEILIDEYRVGINDSLILYTGYTRLMHRTGFSRLICTNRIAKRIEEAGVFSFSDMRTNN